LTKPLLVVVAFPSQRPFLAAFLLLMEMLRIAEESFR